MMDFEDKAKLARKLTGALHQAPGNPEQFTTVTQQVLRSNNLHITDLAITIGDLTGRLAKQLEAARRNAPPTFDNLLDMARTKLPSVRNPERMLAKIIGVSPHTMEERKRSGRVPRAWFDKVQALPELDETHSYLDAVTKRGIQALAAKGYSSREIEELFRHIWTARVGAKQIATAMHEGRGNIDMDELSRMQLQLFGQSDSARESFHLWLAAQLRVDAAELDDVLRDLIPQQVERLRMRFARETDLRDNDPAYRTAARAADSIPRPLRATRQQRPGNALSDSNELRRRLSIIFSDAASDSVAAIRLAQLTGLDERHIQDLLKGANRVGDVWWRFLDKIELELHGPRARKAEASRKPTDLSSVNTSDVQPRLI